MEWASARPALRRSRRESGRAAPLAARIGALAANAELERTLDHGEGVPSTQMRSNSHFPTEGSIANMNKMAALENGACAAKCVKQKVGNFACSWLE